jgi:excinuclease ABC subunit A
VEAALEIAEGTVIALREAPWPGTQGPPTEEFFSQRGACPECGISLPEMEPRLFSFNAPQGACPVCSGLGIKLEFDPDLVIPDRSLSFNEGGCIPYNPDAAWNRSRFEALAKHFKFSLDTAFEDLPKKVLDAILYGTDEAVKIKYENREGTGRFEYESRFPGILADLKRRYLETQSDGIKTWLERFMSEKPCDACDGSASGPRPSR